MDSVTLRNSHFKLGDDKNKYRTSSMDQSEGIENAGKCTNPLNQQTKNELRKSHFIFGNFEPNFNTTFRSEYYDKSNSLSTRNNKDLKSIERKLRSQNFEFGTDKPDYLSETAAKYIIPKFDTEGNKQNKVSTAFLQQSHYVFGTSNAPWNTTHRREFTPKKADNQKYTKDLTRTNFVLGDDKPTIKSVNEEVYIKHPLQSNNLDQKLLSDLRTHHFEFGKDDVPNQHVTQNQLTYQNPNLYPDQKFRPVLDNQLLRQTHWSMGDKSQELPDMYNSAYNRAHTPKKAEKKIVTDNNSFKSSFNINGNGPMLYQTDYRANYIPLNNKLDPKEKKIIDETIKTIKNSHFDLGDMGNDYNTIMSSSYKFNPEDAKNAKGILDKKLLNDLRSTHYILGDDNNIVKQTTQRRDYIPYNLKGNLGNKPMLQDSHFNLGDQNNNKFEGETIYMSDYVPKDLPPDENDCWC